MFSRGSSLTREGLEPVATYVDVAESRAFWETFHAAVEKTEGPEKSSLKSKVQNDASDKGAPNSEPAVDNLDPNVDVAFKRDVDFTGAVFLGPAWFVDIVFSGSASFVGATFSSRAYFRQARFLKRIDFEGVTFADDVDFYNASFYTAVRFYKARFEQSVLFSETVFNFDAYFSHTRFTKLADFSGAAFNDGAVFKAAAFGSKVDFTRTLFRGAANFEGTSFSSDVLFDRSLFSMAFLKRLPNTTDPISESATGQVVADFTGAIFSEPQLVHFRRVNQEYPNNAVSGAKPDGFRVRFLDCDVSGVHLDAVNWHRDGNRMVLEDEIVVSRRRILPEERHELVSLTYQQLVTNFEKNGFYELAEDCYIGSMEMKRRDHLRPPFVRVILTFYRWASSYGSNYSRAFAVLIGMVVLTALLLTLPPAGLMLAQPSDAHQLLSGLRVLPAGLFHAFEIASFQRDTLYSATTIFGRLVSMTAGILIPAQLALFLLAVRRRFRR